MLFRLLDEVLAPELIPSLLKEKIEPYCHQYQISVDTLLLHYMKVCVREREERERDWDGEGEINDSNRWKNEILLLHCPAQHMLNRIPRLTADSPWEAKAIAVIRSISSQQASCPVSVGQASVIHCNVPAS